MCLLKVGMMLPSLQPPPISVLAKGGSCVQGKRPKPGTSATPNKKAQRIYAYKIQPPLKPPTKTINSPGIAIPASGMPTREKYKNKVKCIVVLDTYPCITPDQCAVTMSTNDNYIAGTYLGRMPEQYNVCNRNE